MRVLAAIFSHPRHVTLGGAGVEVRFVERRIEQQDQTGIPADEPTIDALYRCGSPLMRAGARKDRPALRYCIDLALFIVGRAERRAVVEVRPAIPLAVPAVLLNIAPQSAGVVRIPVREHCVAAPPRQGGELRE